MTIPATFEHRFSDRIKEIESHQPLCSGIAASPRLKSSANTTICSNFPFRRRLHDALRHDVRDDIGKRLSVEQ